MTHVSSRWDVCCCISIRELKPRDVTLPPDWDADLRSVSVEMFSPSLHIFSSFLLRTTSSSHFHSFKGVYWCFSTWQNHRIHFSELQWRWFRFWRDIKVQIQDESLEKLLDWASVSLQNLQRSESSPWNCVCCIESLVEPAVAAVLKNKLNPLSLRSGS